MVTKLVWSSLARKSGSATTPEAKQLQGDEKDAAENVQTEKKTTKTNNSSKGSNRASMASQTGSS